MRVPLSLRTMFAANRFGRVYKSPGHRQDYGFASSARQGLRYAEPPGCWFQRLYLDRVLPCPRPNAAPCTPDHSSIYNSHNSIYSTSCWQYNQPSSTGTGASQPIPNLSNHTVTCFIKSNACAIAFGQCTYMFIYRFYAFPFVLFDFLICFTPFALQFL